MKTIKHYISIIFCGMLVCCIACSDLNEEVFSDITEASYVYEAGDATKVVGAAYANLRGYLGWNTFYAQQICTDETVQPAFVGGWDDGGTYRRMHLHYWNTEQAHVNDLWSMCYSGIILANRAISLLQGADFPFAANEDKTVMIAESRALRAFYYWQVMDNFGDAPLVTEPGIELPGKATRQQIYDFVVTELTECMGNLSEDKNAANYGRFNKWAAKALLANVYLNAEVYTGTAQWASCIAQCNDILAAGKYALDVNYRDPFKANNENSLENIFVIPADHIYGAGFIYYRISLHVSSQATFQTREAPWGSGSYRAVPQFIDTYDADDQRLTDTWLSGQQFGANGEVLYCTYELAGQPLVYVNRLTDGIKVGEADGFRFYKYEIPLGWAFESLDNDLVVFRLAQVYMMKAESLLRSGDADQAAQIVTTIRQRVFSNTVPAKATVTGTELQQPSKYVYGTVANYVFTPQGKSFPEKFGRFYDELGWEFAGEMVRRRDMIRFGHFTKAEWLSHVPNGDYRSVFPIPQIVIDTNPKLEQNPNYQ